MYERSMESLRKNFILGMDASSVPAEEAGGVKYYGFDGSEQDVFRTLADCGINYIRVRIWNDPYDRDGNGYGGGNCDTDTAVLIGKRAAKCGMKLLADFHYSDFWADPGKQMAPKAWKDYDMDQKAEAVYEYTRDSLKKLRTAGVDVGMVQVGNETNGALCGETDWENICRLMNAGSKAVREVYPNALVALHFANPEKTSTIKSYAFMADQYGVDYDVFGVSYYPFWHGTLENLSELLSYVSEKYGKRVMVMETSYAYTPEDTDFFSNTISSSSDAAKPYPYSVQGQAESISDVIRTVAGIDGGIGVCYWEGCWISVGGSSRSENQKLWESFGSGWASSFAAEYDPDDAGRWYGGCAVDNQALFDAEGRPLESLKAFRNALP
ncbi:MAG: glycosyl hydrolase 53 family protein [Firmicutes bacterium]|nr:glycosyl hydrolase 53 family protein [Bacillota bacterium]